MSVIVSFAEPKGVGSINSPGVGNVRIRETLALNGTSTASVAEGEIVFIGNAEADMIFVAFGTTPDAAAAAQTAATSAGLPVGAGQTVALVPPKGSKINVKALS